MSKLTILVKHISYVLQFFPKLREPQNYAVN